jgi:methionyl aminopeptidase
LVALKTPWEIEKMHTAGQVVAEVLARLKEHIQPGVTTWELNVLSEEWALQRNATPAFKGYRGYPFALCTSVNDEVVHGMPSKHRRLEQGDIISVDFGVVLDGYYGDAAVTLPVGPVSEEAMRLCSVTEQALHSGIAKAVQGNRLSDISHAIQTHAENSGFTVVREFVGHGIGRRLHENPQIPNYGQPGRGLALKQGMVFAIEPMVNAGRPDIRILTDQWTAVTADRKLSSHFEHTVAIMDNGPKILTQLK